MICALSYALLSAIASENPTVLSLDGADWQLSSVTTSLKNATVPGGVWDNMHRARKIGDPLYRDNDLVFINATTALPGGWTFSKNFDVPATAIAPGKHI